MASCRCSRRCWSRCGAGTSRWRLVAGSCAAIPEDGPGQVVGFADLVGFTALAQQVTDEELAEVVDQFERLAYDVVVAGGGRVVKMIGDEVMFLVDDPVFAAEIALGLAEASRDATELSDVRVGLAVGPVIEREGDAFGATVNLASRATAIAYPGTVVVSSELRELLEDRPEYSFRSHATPLPEEHRPGVAGRAPARRRRAVHDPRDDRGAPSADAGDGPRAARAARFGRRGERGLIATRRRSS